MNLDLTPTHDFYPTSRLKPVCHFCPAIAPSNMHVCTNELWFLILSSYCLLSFTVDRHHPFIYSGRTLGCFIKNKLLLVFTVTCWTSGFWLIYAILFSSHFVGVQVYAFSLSIPADIRQSFLIWSNSSLYLDIPSFDNHRNFHSTLT